MAKAYLEKRLEELGKTGIEVSSAGIASFAGLEATEYAKEVIKGEGSDISGHSSKTITNADIQESDLIFAMELRHRLYLIAKYPQAAGKIYLLKDFKNIGNINISEDPDVPDPIGRDLEFYKKVFSIVKESIERLLQQL